MKTSLLMLALGLIYSMPSFAKLTECFISKGEKRIERCYLGDMYLVNNGKVYSTVDVRECDVHSKKYDAYVIFRMSKDMNEIQGSDTITSGNFHFAGRKGVFYGDESKKTLNNELSISCAMIIGNEGFLKLDKIGSF